MLLILLFRGDPANSLTSHWLITLAHAGQGMRKGCDGGGGGGGGGGCSLGRTKKPYTVHMEAFTRLVTEMGQYSSAEERCLRTR